jgi:hypothetical protein
MPPCRRYVLWGALLGSGVATPILSSAVLVLLGAQLTAGVLLGAATGAVFGVTRESLALVPGLRGASPEATMGLLPRLRPATRRLNALVALGGGLALVLIAWP